MMDFDQFKDTMLMVLGGSFVVTIAWVARSALSELRALRASVETLNLNVAGLLAQVGGHETRIARLENKE